MRLENRTRDPGREGTGEESVELRFESREFERREQGKKKGQQRNETNSPES